MKYLVPILISLMFSVFSFGQNSLGKKDDIGRIEIKTIIKSGTLKPNSEKILKNRLKQIIVKNGLGSSSKMPRFAVVASVDVVDENITNTAPIMYTYNLELNLYVVDMITKAVYSSLSQELKGVGRSRNKAQISALKRVNSRSAIYKRFLIKGKDQIIEYYNSKCDFITTKAKTLSSIGKLDEALKLLLDIPEVCAECYDSCMKLSEELYKKYAKNTSETLDEHKESLRKEIDSTEEVEFVKGK